MPKFDNGKSREAQRNSATETGLSRRQILAVTGGAIGGMASLSKQVGVGATTASDNITVTTENLGTAAPSAVYTAAVCLVNNNIYTINNETVPNPTLSYLNLDTRNIRNFTIPSGEGSWNGLIGYNSNVYLGTTNPADFYHFDMENEDISLVAKNLAEWTRELAKSPDGRIFIGTYNPGSVYEYNPEKGEMRDFGTVAESEEYVDSLAVGSETIYAGTGPGAHLVAINRDTGDKQHILPDEFEGLSAAVWVTDITSTKIVIQILRGGFPGDFVVLDRQNPSNYYSLGPPEADSTSQFTVENDIVYLTALRDGETYLYQYDPITENYTALSTVPPVGHKLITNSTGNKIATETVGGSGWVYDLDSGVVEEYNFVEQGMRLGAAQPQSIVVTPKKTPLVSGEDLNFHYPESMEPEKIGFSGESKRMITARGRVYLAKYPDASLHKYENGELTQLADIEKGQNRPRDLYYHDSTGFVLIGTRPNYGELGGAIAAYKPGANTLTVERNVIQDQSIHVVASIDETVFLGSEIYGGIGTEPTASEARLAAWDPVTRTKRWQITPVAGAKVIDGLVAVGSHLYGLTDSGTLFVVDTETQSVIHQNTNVADNGGELAVQAGHIYGSTNETLIRVNPKTYEVTKLLNNLDQQWYTDNQLSIDERGFVYMLDGYDLLRVGLPGPETGPGDEVGPGNKYGLGAEHGPGNESGPGGENGPGNEYGLGEEHGPGEGHGGI